MLTTLTMQLVPGGLPINVHLWPESPISNRYRVSVAHGYPDAMTVQSLAISYPDRRRAELACIDALAGYADEAFPEGEPWGEWPDSLRRIIMGHSTLDILAQSIRAGVVPVVMSQGGTMVGMIR